MDAGSISAATTVKPERDLALTIIAGGLLVVNVASAMLRGHGGQGLLGPRAIGAAVATFLFAAVAYVVGYGVASLLPNRAKRRRRAMGTVVGVMSLILLGECARIGRKAQTFANAPLTEEERADLVATGDRLRHPVFGFSLAHPGGGFTVDTAAQRAVNDAMAARGGGNLFTWALIREDPPVAATVQVATGVEPTEAAFREFTDGLRTPTVSSEVLVILSHSFTWAGSTREFRMTTRHSDGYLMLYRCVPSPAERPKPFFVCAMAAGMDSSELGAITNGLAVDATTPSRRPGP